jgi:hypothetical protein
VTSTLPGGAPAGDYYCQTCERAFPAGDHCPHDGTRLVKLVVADDPFVGRELDGRYTITAKLGEGGMGTVYRAVQHSVEREVAIKVIAPQHVRDRDAIRRFLREAKLAGKLAHPNAVAVHESGATGDGVFFLVMELVAGDTLEAVLARDKRVEPARAIRIAIQICDVLAVAHAMQIVHRDLKPANIMLADRDRVKVLDFGLAKMIAADHGTMTQAGELLGTPAFMAPELALGQPCDGRADQYSLGCVLYLMVAGRLPFVSASTPELIALHAYETPPRLDGVSPALAAVVARMLAKSPEERFASADANRAALGEVLDADAATEQTGTFAKPRSAAVAVASPPRRQRWPIVGGVLAVAALSGLAAIAWLADLLPASPEHPSIRAPAQPQAAQAAATVPIGAPGQAAEVAPVVDASVPVPAPEPPVPAQEPEVAGLPAGPRTLPAPRAAFHPAAHPVTKTVTGSTPTPPPHPTAGSAAPPEPKPPF